MRKFVLFLFAPRNSATLVYWLCLLLEFNAIQLLSCYTRHSSWIKVVLLLESHITSYNPLNDMACDYPEKSDGFIPLYLSIEEELLWHTCFSYKGLYVVKVLEDSSTFLCWAEEPYSSFCRDYEIVNVLYGLQH